MSEFAYENAVARSGEFTDAAEYAQVAVSNKEFRGLAWMRLLDQSLPHPVAGRDSKSLL
jgi:hypothetical protein